MLQGERWYFMEDVVHALSQKGGGIVLYFEYKVNSGENPYDETIHLDLTDPVTLVVTEEMKNVYHVSILAHGEKLEWTVDEIVSLKFGFTREIV
jgi:hypothetical protein